MAKEKKVVEDSIESSTQPNSETTTERELKKNIHTVMNLLGKNTEESWWNK